MEMIFTGILGRIVLNSTARNIKDVMIKRQSLMDPQEEWFRSKKANILVKVVSNNNIASIRLSGTLGITIYNW